MTRWLAIFSAALLIAFLTYIGPAYYADELDRDADMKLLRAQIAGRSEHTTTPADAADGQASDTIFPLLHPLGCGGAYVRNCADFGPCLVTCLGE